MIPPVNLTEHITETNVNMVTCGGQATIPMVYAVSRCVPVAYAEIVATVASKSAGPGTRANIDEFTSTTASAVESIGGADRGKAIIILNPAEPPLIMRDTIFCSLPDRRRRGRRSALRSSTWSPRCSSTCPATGCAPSLSSIRPVCSASTAVCAIFLEVEGAGDFLPSYSGNLDIMTAAATKVGEVIARHLLEEAPDDDRTSSWPTASGRPSRAG